LKEHRDKEITEGDLYASNTGDIYEAVIIDQNDQDRLCYWYYSLELGDYIYFEVDKPSYTAKEHIHTIKRIRNRQNKNKGGRYEKSGL